MTGLFTDTIAESTSGSGITFSNDIVPATPLSHRNMIINGAMKMAQRGTSADGQGYGTVDRFKTDYNGVDENPTQSQHALTSSDTGPYEEGFRNSFHITNGNQTGGVATGDRIIISHLIEAQDVANFGWNYTSSSSYITFSFWCKSSVAQNFYGRLQTSDGTAQNYAFETGSLSANTWTKITKTIPGNSNLQFDNDNNAGLTIEFNLFRGTLTTGSVTLNTWGAYNSSARVPDMTSTWYTTNDATWEITGVQLERGQVATPFEHRSYADELRRCQRYFYAVDNSDPYHMIAQGASVSTTLFIGIMAVPVTFRGVPDLTTSGSYEFAGTIGGDATSLVITDPTTSNNIQVRANGSFTSGQPGYLRNKNDTNAKFELDAEL